MHFDSNGKAFVTKIYRNEVPLFIAHEPGCTSFVQLPNFDVDSSIYLHLHSALYVCRVLPFYTIRFNVKYTLSTHMHAFVLFDISVLNQFSKSITGTRSHVCIRIFNQYSIPLNVFVLCSCALALFHVLIMIFETVTNNQNVISTTEHQYCFLFADKILACVFVVLFGCSIHVQHLINRMFMKFVRFVNERVPIFNKKFLLTVDFDGLKRSKLWQKNYSWSTSKSTIKFTVEIYHQFLLVFRACPRTCLLLEQICE